MKETIERIPLSEEYWNLDRSIKVLESTEGFLLLSKKQQQIIKQSLYLQNRAGREEYHQIDDKLKYEKSTVYVSKMLCHLAILSVEEEQRSQNFTREEIEINLPKDFFEAEYIKVNTKDELKKYAEKFGFPCIVHIGYFLNPNESISAEKISHSFFVLGHDKNSGIVVWEKQDSGQGNPFRLTTIEREFDSRFGDQHIYWGFRKLKNRKN